MASSQTFESCSENKIPVADETYQPTEHVQRAQWLRAAILGANDGLLSTTSLMLGVGAAKDDRWSMILSGLAGALAGACSMAVGEFVSVSTQRDIEQATAACCTSKTDTGMQHDHVKNLDMISSPTTVKASKLRETNLGMLDTPTPTRTAPCRNLTCSEPTEKIPPPVIILEPKLPQVLSHGRSSIIKVITKDLSTKAVESVQNHMEKALPNPYKAAAASTLAFLCGSVVPLATAVFIAENIIRIVVIAVVTSIALALFGCFGAHLGGLPVRVSAARVLVGGWIAMAITYGLLKPFDTDHESRDTD
ncbi:PREDICTED: vacuolar iron transporter homolog 5-like [Theobroma cacao]|uniref:Vacuolar iron transporter homolog 5-like n=1 Tax=Theobroma cacao TaxID=3641 RepID=A0AB32W1W7_THECC|nr:PREDICTED: vacuolar iron transporter homolog 5-like [Theobroma cacao]